MNITEGINWVINCTSHFEQTVAFFRAVLGLSITAEGVPTANWQAIEAYAHEADFAYTALRSAVSGRDVGAG